MIRNTLLPLWPVVVLALIATGQAPAQEVGFGDLNGSDTYLARTPAITALPAYPDEAQRDRLEGETTVCFVVDSRGRVTRPDVRSSTHKIFERPAVKASRASRFEPLAAVRTRPQPDVCRTYRFDLAAMQAANESTESVIASAGTTASLMATTSPLTEISTAEIATAFAPGGADIVFASADGGELITDRTAMAVQDPTGETICRTLQRPGSRISERACFTRQEELAAQAASRRAIADLENEQHWRDQAIQEAAMKNRYPGAPGMPNR